MTKPIAPTPLFFAPNDARTCQVQRVHDGDTVAVIITLAPGIIDSGPTGTGLLVRLARINAPELGAPGGAAAQQFLITLVAAAKIVIITTNRRDNYGRILSELWLDGVAASDTIYQAGHAVAYP